MLPPPIQIVVGDAVILATVGAAFTVIEDVVTLDAMQPASP
jgi:hypothetical protein